MVEIPILEITFTTPLTAALTKFLQASLCSMFVEQALTDHVIQRFKREIRIDGAGPVADEQREMMHFPRLAGFEDQANARARAFADEVMMQACNGQQRRDGGVFAIHPAIGKMRMFSPHRWRIAGASQSSSMALPKPRSPPATLKRIGSVSDFETRMVDVLELGEFFVRQNGRLELDQLALSGFGSSRLRFGTDRRFRRK